MELPAGPSPAKQNDAIRLERGLAQLCAAVRWVRRRDDVFPDKIGVLGWGKTGTWRWKWPPRRICRPPS